MSSSYSPQARSRLGFHYFPDALHYRDVDLQAWLPEISALGASWLTLLAPNDRAIPEYFIRALLQEYIEPVLHFHLPLDHVPDLDDLGLLLKVYREWGVSYVALFDRPNLQSSWSETSWAQSDLVERFLDLFLPTANLVLQSGLLPIFPPLEPGGDYWDTAFLRAALRGMQRRGHRQLADNLILSAYSWSGENPLGWGAGGPERWPQAKPYHTPEGQQDQQGFYIFDWYLAIAEAELRAPRPIILLAAGYKIPDAWDPDEKILDAHTATNLDIARLMSEKTVEDPVQGGPLPPVSAQVLACNFWLLAARRGSPELRQAWFQPDGTTLPIVDALHQLHKNPDAKYTINPKQASASPKAALSRPIAHYLLLPALENQGADRIAQTLWSYIYQHHPTVGFSLEEATLAAKVTLAGSDEDFSDVDLDGLRSAGCIIEHLTGDGTSIAPQPSTPHTD